MVALMGRNRSNSKFHSEVMIATKKRFAISVLKNCPLFALMMLCISVRAAEAPRLEVIDFESPSLKNNPLHDPVRRKIAIFVPSQCSNNCRLPIVYYLPGFGGSSDGFIRRSNQWLAFTQKLADEVTPMLFVAIDARTRWGCSQYLNSPAQGKYASYICDDVVREVEKRYPAPLNGVRRIIAGHSSGGFGALRLGMAEQKLFDGVIALSPDSDFPVTHLPLVKLAGVTNGPWSEIKMLAAGTAPAPKNGDLLYAVALSAAYAPAGRFHPGRFQWLYDAREHLRQNVWQRWLDNDPLTIAETNPRAFSARQVIYLDGAARDEYSANIGAREIYKAICNEPARCAFYEPPGRHGDHLPARLERGLEWIWGRPLEEIQ